MKNKILIVFLFVLLIPTQFAFAIFLQPLKPAGIGNTNIGSQTNPIYIQVKPDTSQLLNSAWDKVNSMQYVSTCVREYDTVKSYATRTLKDDLGDPNTQTSDANYLNYLYSSYQTCVNHAAQTQDPQYNDQICSNKFGKNSKWDGTKSSTGAISCGCKDGYTQNNGECVVESVAPVRTNNPVSTPALICNGKPWNDCPVGQKFYCPSTGDAQCITTPKSEIKTPQVKKTPDRKTSQTQINEAFAKYEPPNPVKPNKEAGPTTEVAKPKGFWSKITNWFGF